MAETPAPGGLGAIPLGGGTRFALWSAHASAVEVCLFDGDAERRVALSRAQANVWETVVPGVAVGARYGFRVEGPWEPSRGHRFNPSKLLIDPYARLLEGPLTVHEAHHDGDRPDRRDTAPFTVKCLVADPLPAVPDAERPRTAWRDTLIYELHVKGLTQRHPGVPPDGRGRYAGLAEPAVIDHLRRLGVTAVELLPVQQHLTRRWLAERHLSDYWGYNPIALRAPDPRFATGGDPRTELRDAVRALHAAGIEVLLDVVFNHTGEGDERGPTLSLRGIDNRSYYRLRADDPARYRDEAGTGNTLDGSQPAVVDLIVESLRTCASEFGVDGFRFDLAPVLARDRAGRPLPELRAAPVLAAIGADPLLSSLKLIAEPWDLARGGYRLGEFPAGWSEWNDRFRDELRQFWTAASPTAGRPTAAGLALRFDGSPDLFAPQGRGAQASVNHVTCHDGFTLRDLVSYRTRHNRANLEGNRDGSRLNHATNLGVEGETDDPAVLEARDRLRRALLACLLLARGVPMLLAGDELGRTQRGNNNAYNQDNSTSWLDWELAEPDRHLLDFVVRATAVRREHPALSLAEGTTRWLPATGVAPAPAVALRLETGPASALLLVMNPSAAGVPLHLPVGDWTPVLATTVEGELQDGPPRLGGRSLVLFGCGSLPPLSPGAAAGCRAPAR